MRKEIIEKLNDLEKTHDVTILYACESGSRAWGFPSLDSDYDVRFVYTHKKNWYLSIAQKKDVIELPVDAVLDINGWDIKKALVLMRKSNAPLLEWMTSPIVYKKLDDPVDAIMDLSKKALLPESSCHHYLALAKRMMDEIYDRDFPRHKIMLYAVRSIMCCNWIIRHKTQPPMRIQQLISDLIEDDTLKEEIERLIAEKAASDEYVNTEIPLAVKDYLEREITALPDKIPKNPEKLSVETFDLVFRRILNQH